MRPRYSQDGLQLTSCLLLLVALVWTSPAAGQDGIGPAVPSGRGFTLSTDLIDDTAGAQRGPADEAPADEMPAEAMPAEESADADETCTADVEDMIAEARIRRQLLRTTSMDFAETPLSDVIEYLRDVNKIEIQLDDKAMNEVGIGSDTPVTRTIKGISLRSAFKLLLRPLDLTTVVRDGVLLVTTVEAAQQMVEIRVYNVAQFLDEDSGDINDLAGAVRTMLTGVNANTKKLPQVGAVAHAGSLQITTFRDLLLVRASLPQHEQLTCLLAQMRVEIEEDPFGSVPAEPAPEGQDQ